MSTTKHLRAVYLTSDRRTLVICLVLFAITPMWFAARDAILFAHGSVPLERVLVQAFPILPPLLGLVLAYGPVDSREFSQLSFWTGMAVASTMFISNLLRPDAEEIPLRGRIMAPALMYLLLSNTFARQVFPPLLLSASLIVLRAVRVDVDPVTFAGDLIIVGVLNTAGVLMVRRRLELESSVETLWQSELVARLEARQSEQTLETLRAIIPICAYCRKVRSECGDWQQLEEYMRADGNVAFSHGICSACRDQHFPEFAGPR